MSTRLITASDRTVHITVFARSPAPPDNDPMDVRVQAEAGAPVDHRGAVPAALATLHAEGARPHGRGGRGAAACFRQSLGTTRLAFGEPSSSLRSFSCIVSLSETWPPHATS